MDKLTCQSIYKNHFSTSRILSWITRVVTEESKFCYKDKFRKYFETSKGKSVFAVNLDSYFQLYVPTEKGYGTFNALQYKSCFNITSDSVSLLFVYNFLNIYDICLGHISLILLNDFNN
jgi:hypothetical protein